MMHKLFNREEDITRPVRFTMKLLGEEIYRQNMGLFPLIPSKKQQRKEITCMVLHACLTLDLEFGLDN